MTTAYFVVDHATDPDKVDGLVESYQMVPVQYEQEDGSVVSGVRRVNFVHWPSAPQPFVHEEWSEDLIFSNIYTPADDLGDDDEDEEDLDEEDYEDEDDEASFSEEDEVEQQEAES